MPQLRTVAKPSLKVLEDVVDRGLDTFKEVGAALAKIRDFELYREAGFKSFVEYAKSRFGIGRTMAYDLIAASTVTIALVRNCGH